jgi:hypothetical protein
VGIAALGVALNDLAALPATQDEPLPEKGGYSGLALARAAPDCFVLRPESPVPILVPWGLPVHPRVQPAGEADPASHA